MFTLFPLYPVWPLFSIMIYSMKLPLSPLLLLPLNISCVLMYVFPFSPPSFLSPSSPFSPSFPPLSLLFFLSLVVLYSSTVSWKFPEGTVHPISFPFPFPFLRFHCCWNLISTPEDDFSFLVLTSLYFPSSLLFSLPFPALFPFLALPSLPFILFLSFRGVFILFSS